MIIEDLHLFSGKEVRLLGKSRKFERVAHHVHPYKLVLSHKPDGHECISARSYFCGHVKLNRRQAAGVLSKQFTMEIYPTCRVNSVKPQVYSLTGPLLRDERSASEHRTVIIVNVRERHPIPVGDCLLFSLRVRVKNLSRLGSGFPHRIIYFRRCQ